MNCQEFEIEWIALEETSRLPAGMEEHRQACHRCAMLVEDLSSILGKSRELRLDAEPPERVWVALRNQLEMEGLIREPAHASPATPRRRAAAWLLGLPMGMAYTTVFLVAVGVMYLNSRISNPGGAPPLVATAPQVPEMAWVRPNTAASDKSMQELIDRVPEEHRATFVSNWNQVNSSIQNLQTFIEAHPDDPFAPPQLMNAFQQREYLMQSLVGREEFR